jgi:hypothetical protein
MPFLAHKENKIRQKIMQEKLLKKNRRGSPFAEMRN